TINDEVVKYVNLTGGIAGRKVQWVDYHWDIAQAVNKSTRNQQQQAACAHWTEDDPVFAIAGTFYMDDDIWLNCAEHAKTPLLLGVPGFHTLPTEKRYQSMSQYFYAPNSTLAMRRERSIAAFFLKHGFLTK